MSTGRLAVMLGVLLVTACGKSNPPPVPPMPPLLVPAQLQSCAAGRSLPTPPPAPRTLQQLVDWAVLENATLIRTERARAECAARLAKLNEWVDLNLSTRQPHQ